MTVLKHLQNEFQDHLFHLTEEFKKNIVASEKFSVDTRLEIYSNAYRARIIEALASTFPILHKYLGDEQFEELGLAYLAEFPSEFRSIRWFGDRLAGFLAQNSQYQEFPFLSELAHFEWIQTLVFDAKDAPIVTLESIAQISPDSWAEMKFAAHPSLYRLQFCWNVVPIWQALSEDNSPPEPVKNAENTEWLLWRKDLLNQFCSLTTDEAWAIDAMCEGKNFGEICEGLCQWVDEHDAPMHAASLLKGWVISGLVAGITFGDASSAVQN